MKELNFENNMNFGTCERMISNLFSDLSLISFYSINSKAIESISRLMLLGFGEKIIDLYGSLISNVLTYVSCDCQILLILYINSFELDEYTVSAFFDSKRFDSHSNTN